MINYTIAEDWDGRYWVKDTNTRANESGPYATLEGARLACSVLRKREERRAQFVLQHGGPYRFIPDDTYVDEGAPYSSKTVAPSRTGGVLLSWEDKLAALNRLGEATLHMRGPGDWYVSHAVEIKDGALLSPPHGAGESPEAAVNDHWRVLVTELPGHCVLVIHATNKDKRRQYRWVSGAWQEVST